MTTSSYLATMLGRAELWIGLAVLGGFLVLFWTLRGSPLGFAAREDATGETPSVAHRDRMIAGVAVGMVLIVLGAVVAVTRSVGWALPLFGLGFGLVLTLISVNSRHRHESPSLRRTVAISQAVLNSALVAGVLIVANVIAFRYGGREIDFTQGSANSLASLSRSQIESLEQPVVFHLVHGRSAMARRQVDRVWQLLELYRAERPDLVRIERLDRFAELSRSDDLARRAPELAAMQGGGVLIEYGEGDDARFAAISNREMFQAPPQEARGNSSAAAGRYVSSFIGEDAVTTALIRLREGSTSKVAFITGHGESGSDPTAVDGSGLQAWKSRLKTVGCEVVEHSLLQARVPDDVDLVIIAGPKEPFKPQEVLRLQEYVDSGKPVLACLGGASGLEDFLKGFNVEIGSGVVVDPRLNLDAQMRFVFCVFEPGFAHDVTRGFESQRAILLVNGAPIHLVGTKGASDENPASANARMTPMPILRSGPDSWIASDPDEVRPSRDESKDQPGPAIVAVAVSERGETRPGTVAEPVTPRLVLISSRGAGDDAVQSVEPTNLDLLMNAAGWLRGRNDSVGLPPQLHASLTLTADPSLRWRLVLVPTVISMAAVVVAGVLVYYIRQE